MKRISGSGVPTLLSLVAWVGVACDQPTATGIEDRPTVQLAVTGSDLMPDLGLARLSGLSVENTSDGRRLLRYSTTIVNVGSGPFEAHGQRASTNDSQMTVFQRIFDDSGGWRDASTGAVAVFGGDGHHHWHVRDLQTAELVRLDNGIKVGTSAKRGFCFWDNRSYRLTLEGAPPSPVYDESGCGDESSLETAMGQSVGWGDIYPAWLPDQYIDITGLGPGRYRLIVTADGFGWFDEADESNNFTWVDIQLRGGKGRAFRIVRYGPAA